MLNELTILLAPFERELLEALPRLQTPPADNTEPMAERWRRLFVEVSATANGEVAPPELSAVEADRKASELAQKGSESMRLAPNLAALQYAKAAQLVAAAGGDYSQHFKNALKCLELEREQGIPRLTPSAWLPTAILLGVVKRAASRGAHGEQE